MKKALTLTLALMLLFTFTACNSGEENFDEIESTGETTPIVTTQKTTTTAASTPNTTTSQQIIQESNPFEEKMIITWCIRYCENYEEGRWDEIELEERFNIDLKVWNIDMYNSEQVTMMVAAGDYPDSGYVHYYEPRNAYNDGMIRSITTDMIQKYLPSYYKILEDLPIGYKVNKIANTDNEYYGLSFVYGSNLRWYCVNGFRLDWLETIGFEIDDAVPFVSDYWAEFNLQDSLYFSNRVFDFNELQEIYRAFTEDDPDRNGEDDTYGLILSCPMHWDWGYIASGMFGFVSDGWDYLYKDPATGDYVPFYAYSGYRDWLEWYEDGTMKGYIVNTPLTPGGSWFDDMYTLWNTGKVGHMYLDSGDTLDTAAGYWDTCPPYTIRQLDPDCKIVITPAVLGPDGKGGNSCKTNPYRDGSFGTWTFGAQVDDAKLARILQLMEYTHFNTEAFYRYYYGIEGVHYKWAGEKSDSAIIKINQEAIPLKYRVGNTPQHIFSTDKFLISFKAWSQKTEFLYALSKFQVENNWFYNYNVEPDKILLNMYMPDDLFDLYTEMKKDKNDDLMTIYNEFTNRVVKHQIANIRTEWIQYIDQLYAAGLEEMVEKIFNKTEFETFTQYMSYDF